MSDDAPRKLTSIDRHFIPAYHAWLVENGFTPDVLIFADHPGVIIPPNLTLADATPVFDPEFGMVQIPLRSIVLNMSPKACSGLRFTDEAIYFAARFGGKRHQVVIPYSAVICLNAREDQWNIYHLLPRKVLTIENAQMSLLPEDVVYGLIDLAPVAPSSEPPRPVKRERPQLSIVK